MSNNELETLRARVAELSAAVGRWEAMAKSVQDHRIEIQRERDAARASAARLREAGAEYLCARQAAERGEHFATGRAVDCEAVFSAARAATDSAEWQSDDSAVMRFAEAMRTKLSKKRAEGRGGWDGPTCNAASLSRMLAEHVLKGDPVDVANFAMMLHQRRERIDSAEWLAKHDAEVAKAERAKMNGELLAAHLVENAAQERAFTLTEKCASLEEQLVAATNDAARAELRVQRLRIALRTFLDFAEGEGFHAAEMRRFFGPNNIKDWRYEFAAAPDSDARLREVMLRVAEWVHEVVMFAPEPVIKSELPEIVDEVLGVKP